MSILIDAKDLSVSLGKRSVLKNVSLQLRAGEILGVVGPNGSGKTTLLRSLLGLVPSDGTILFQSQPLSLRNSSHEIGYLPQGITCHWEMSVRRVVELGRIPRLPAWTKIREEDRLAVDMALDELQLVSLAERPFHELSGGEQMRVLIARVLAGQPRVIFADEPLSGLDPYHQLLLLDAFRAFAQRSIQGVFLVLHDLSLAARFCDRVLLMSEGSILAEGPPAQALTAERLSSAYHIDVFVEPEKMIIHPLQRRSRP